MKKISRRQFLYCSAAVLSTTMPFRPFWPLTGTDSEASRFFDIRGKIFKGDAPAKLWKWSHEGLFYTKLKENRVACGICPNRCVLAPGDLSVCRSKVNIDGTLYSLAYGNPCSVHVDPIEKKPLFHFKPKSRAFSLAATGCNFRCLNCQNWEISQVKPWQVRHVELFPPEVVIEAKRAGAKSIAYTYSEPTTFFEYMIDIARMVRENGLYNLWISNGYINRKPLLELCKVLDAANVNLKAYSDVVYRKLNGGRLEPVLNTFKTLHEQGVHFEVTNLVVPGYVDDTDMAKRMCGWILKNLGPDYPLHFLRFFPRYKLDRLSPTPISTLTRFRELAMHEGIRYVYVGNVPGHEGNNTYCHNCRKLLVERKGYLIPIYNLAGNKCKFCNTVIPGVWV
ncbi:MAG: AmmeMemoRadiSam system radical SAM enzyme [Desulfobacterales bacterium]|uniref:AmmeMemoRadiSam system radical SAM enzyme n=1 Tax=Candidatus Desulfaltia bathyphila TaxID=2841697 RepID=A0A8J6N5S2_9BACT|nr:AmmeMemoRadiSam system radical SAM enzyme [Candidatus Desulfaltia bathyphila]MBL7195400.1 AmmeMemoRadiSam system radical SAM enzyme [Desulfobacterales bacterium]MBL7207096.1 AmmeMemoRadiSam system radical SAM enzyme [Desulfobacterales bacterium]